MVPVPPVHFPFRAFPNLPFNGFLALADVSEVIYKTTDYWDPHCENIIRWDDPLIRIDWPLSNPPVLAAKDAVAPLLDLNGLYY